MAQLATYLTFDGTCAEAIRFYERVLNGKIGFMMKIADSPMATQMPPEAQQRIMHARLDLGDQVLMASDSMGHEPYHGMHGFTMSLSYDTVEEGQPFFDALAEGGKVTMPLQETFWADGFGMLTDRFGTPWMINCGMRQP